MVPRFALRPTLIVPACWLGSCVAALLALEAYNSQPGEELSAKPSSTLVQPATVAPRPDTALRILMFVHPLCPCTRASLHELGNLVASATHRPRTEIVVLPDFGDSHSGPLVELARTIPGATIRLARPDELERWGAATSGHVVILDAQGHALFRGGITRARGHEGSSTGGRAVAQLLRDRAADTDRAPVFGCPLLSPAEPAGERRADSGR